MNTHKGTMSRTLAERAATIVSPETCGLMLLGRQRGWDFAILGQAPIPHEPVRQGDWLLVPAHQDTSPIPARTLERVQAIFDTGLRPKGFVVVHEAPKLLPALAQDESSNMQLFVLPAHLRLTMKVVGGVLGTVGTGFLVFAGIMILAVAAFLVAAILVACAALVAGAVALDPILIAVTEDGYWIEIDRWQST